MHDTTYFQRITPLLSAVEEAALISVVHGTSLDDHTLLSIEVRAACASSEAARTHLIYANQGLVTSIAKRYAHPDIPLDDAIQDGNIGLFRAIDKYDPAKGRFSTCAYQWIRKEIQVAQQNTGRLIRIPVHMHNARAAIHREGRRLTQELRRTPTLAEIGAVLGKSEQWVSRILIALSDIGSLDAPVKNDKDGHDSTATPHNIVIDYANSVESLVATREYQRELRTALQRLPLRTARVLRLRCGLDDGQSRTFAEVASTLGLTKQRVQQIEREGTKTLERWFQAAGA